MAFSERITALLFTVLVLGCIDFSASQQVVKGTVSCLDCPQYYDLAGIQVLVKCDKVKKLAMAATDRDGVFQVDLPRDDEAQNGSPRKCDAKIYGGPNQIYGKNTNMVSEVVKSRDSDSYTVTTPLAFYATCSSGVKCVNNDVYGSSKTLNLPVPPEWGLAPTSYYVPFIPIIGIP